MLFMAGELGVFGSNATLTIHGKTSVHASKGAHHEARRDSVVARRGGRSSYGREIVGLSWISWVALVRKGGG